MGRAAAGEGDAYTVLVRRYQASVSSYCVRATALDAVREGFATRLLPDLCAGVAEESSAAALAEMRDAGISVG